MPKPSPILFTQNGFEDLQKEFESLNSKRPEYVEELRKASELGDRSENAAYKVSKSRLRQTDSRLRYLQKVLDRAKVVKATQSKYVEIGSTVIVHNGKRDSTFTIVGGNESDPSKGLLSYQSPLGQKLLKKRVGDVVELVVPAGIVRYTISSISI